MPSTGNPFAEKQIEWRAPEQFDRVWDAIEAIDDLALVSDIPAAVYIFEYTEDQNGLYIIAEVIASQDIIEEVLSPQELDFYWALFQTTLVILEEDYFEVYDSDLVDQFDTLEADLLAKFQDFVEAANGHVLEDPVGSAGYSDDDAIFFDAWTADLLEAAGELQGLLNSGELPVQAYEGFVEEVLAIYQPLLEDLQASAGTDIDDGLLMQSFRAFRDTAGDFVADVLAGIPASDTATSQLTTIVDKLQAKAVPGLVVVGTRGGDLLEGGEGADLIEGRDGNDSLRGGDGDDVLFGDAGRDVALFDASLAAVGLDVANGEIVSVSGPEGSDRLSGVERAWFSDGAIAADTDIADDGAGSAGAAYGLLWAARSALGGLFSDADLRATELGRWIDRFDAGDSLAQVAAQAIEHYTGGAGVTDAALVEVLYQNITGRPIEQSELDTFVGLIDDGTYSQSTLYQYAVTLPDVEALIEPEIAAGIVYAPFEAA